MLHILRSKKKGLLPYWVKVEIERLVVSISIHCIWTTPSGSPVSFCYVMIQQTGKSSCRVVASSCLLVAVTSTSEWPRVRTCTVASVVLNTIQCLCKSINSLETYNTDLVIHLCDNRISIHQFMSSIHKSTNTYTKSWCQASGEFYSNFHQVLQFCEL